jgi:hypothetical protein
MKADPKSIQPTDVIHASDAIQPSDIIHPSDDVKPSLLLSMAANKCPRCRRGHLFSDPNPYHLRHIVEMHETCPVCGQPFDLEVGFYFGTSYVSYALSFAFSVATFITWWVFWGFSTQDNRIFYWLIGNCLLLVLLQPIIMRWARAVWLAFFVPYDPEWKSRPPRKPERDNDALKNAW